MNRPEFQKILEQAWKPGSDISRAENLTAQERAALVEELTLTRLLAERPKTPVSTNFTARVLEQAQRKSRSSSSRRWWRKFPRLAIGFGVVAIAAAGILQYRTHTRARDIADVSSLAAMPKIEWLKDFEAIDRLNPVTPDDRDVLLVLNQR